MNQKTTKANNLVHPRQSEIVSIVRPVLNNAKTNKTTHLQISDGNNSDKNILDDNITNTSIINNNGPISYGDVITKPSPTASVFTELQSSKNKLLANVESPIELIPETRDHPTGFNLDDFLPKHLQDTIRFGYHPQPEMSESEAIQAILRGHKSVVTALSHRKKNLQIVLAMWNTKDPRSALEHSINVEDQSVIVDILNIVTLKP